MVKRFEVYWVRLDPTYGHKIKKTRPAAIISQDKDNSAMSTVVIAPLTSTIKEHHLRISCEFQGRAGSIVLDQLRSVDKRRLQGKMGKLDQKYQTKVLAVLKKMFS
jgi:mRNA interferase MazF